MGDPRGSSPPSLRPSPPPLSLNQSINLTSSSMMAHLRQLESSMTRVLMEAVLKLTSHLTEVGCFVMFETLAGGRQFGGSDRLLAQFVDGKLTADGAELVTFDEKGEAADLSAVYEQRLGTSSSQETRHISDIVNHSPTLQSNAGSRKRLANGSVIADSHGRTSLLASSSPSLIADHLDTSSSAPGLPSPPKILKTVKLAKSNSALSLNDERAPVHVKEEEEVVITLDSNDDDDGRFAPVVQWPQHRSPVLSSASASSSRRLSLSSSHLPSPPAISASHSLSSSSASSASHSLFSSASRFLPSSTTSSVPSSREPVVVSTLLFAATNNSSSMDDDWDDDIEEIIHDLDVTPAKAAEDVKPVILEEDGFQRSGDIEGGRRARGDMRGRTASEFNNMSLSSSSSTVTAVASSSSSRPLAFPQPPHALSPHAQAESLLAQPPHALSPRAQTEGLLAQHRPMMEALEASQTELSLQKLDVLGQQAVEEMFTKGTAAYALLKSCLYTQGKLLSQLCPFRDRDIKDPDVKSFFNDNFEAIVLLCPANLRQCYFRSRF